MPRSTKAETEARVEEVYRLLLGGATYPDVRDYAAAPERNWQVSETSLRRYMTSAYRKMRQRWETRAEHSFARAMLRRETLFAHCVAAGDFQGALAVLKDQARLEGHYPDERREAGQGGATVTLHIAEMIVHREPPVTLQNVREEIVSNGSNHADASFAIGHNGTTEQDGQAAPGTGGLPGQ
jgi:hypothetical protein